MPDNQFNAPLFIKEIFETVVDTGTTPVCRHRLAGLLVSFYI